MTIRLGFIFMLILATSVAVFSQEQTGSGQSAVASKTAVFSKIDKDDPVYNNALDAHDLTGTLKLIGKEGSFRGTVSQLFEQRGGSMVIIDFDPNYRTAVTAILKSGNFAKFPDLAALKGKEIVVTGKFADYNGKAQIELADAKQIKLVK